MDEHFDLVWCCVVWHYVELQCVKASVGSIMGVEVLIMPVGDQFRWRRWGNCWKICVGWAYRGGGH